jgi:hypothetical protein
MRILVPTDFSAFAETHYKLPLQLQKNNCENILLHLLELPHQMNDAVTEGLFRGNVIYSKTNENLKK